VELSISKLRKVYCWVCQWFFKSANILQSYLPPAPELQQASCTSLLLTVDGTDGQTDGHRTVTQTLTAKWAASMKVIEFLHAKTCSRSTAFAGPSSNEHEIRHHSEATKTPRTRWEYSYASAVYVVVACPSVCLSQAGIVSIRLEDWLRLLQTSDQKANKSQSVGLHITDRTQRRNANIRGPRHFLRSRPLPSDLK